MAIRKEQVLAIVALVFGALAARGSFEEPRGTARFNPTKNEFAPKAFVPTALVTTAPGALVRRDFCTEPSETRPLPPRQLDFPPRQPLSMAALPLDPGPDHRHGYQLRVDGAPLAGITIAQSGEPAPAEAPAAPVETSPGGGRAEAEARAALTYDRVYYGGLQSAQFGTLETEGVDLYALEERGDFSGVTLRMRRYDVTRQKVGEMLTFPGEFGKIDKIVLAGTLRNEITRRERKVPELPTTLLERRELINWLLDKARETSWVYDKALYHAELYRQLSRGDLDGLRLMQRVLRARGDLAGELAMLEALPTVGAEGAFRFEGLGQMKARLGLWLEAEADLRQAGELQRSDARPHAALAEFLRQRGRSREALAVARRAEQTLGAVQDPREKARIGRVIASCHLAVGDHAAARAVFTATQSKDAPQPYVEACVLYAAGDATTALGMFRNAGSSADSGAAQYGQAACLAWMGNLQEAHDLFLRVYDQEPLLRHRAATGLAWVFVRSGQYESALVWLDRAQEADPQDAWQFYLRGRTLRLAGQLGAAEEALAQALRLRDDFVHAIAEMAAVQSTRAHEGRGEEQVTAAVAARRYADRAVELVATPSMELCELQGLYTFDVADLPAAKAAFLAGRDLASDDKAKWYGKGALAVCDYSRGLVEDAQTVLQRMTEELGREEPIAKWAARTLEAIDDHAQKESLADGFDRGDVGTIWFGDADGPLGPKMDGGRLVFRDKFSRTGKGEVYVERVGAIKRGKNFLAVGAVVQAGGKQSRSEGFFGLGLEIQRGNGGVECQVRLGIKEGKPCLRLEDGRENGVENQDQKYLDIAGFDFAGRHELELRVIPRGDPSAKQFELLASWNGLVVYRRDLKTLSGNTNTELKTILFVTGNKGDDVDVAFDDYRLERRKER